MFDSLVSFLKRFWIWLNREPKDLRLRKLEKRFEAEQS